MSSTFSSLRTFFMQSYNSTDLISSYKSVLKSFFNKEQEFLRNRRDLGEVYFLFTKKTLNKADIAYLAATVYSNEELFHKFRTSLPQETIALLDYSVWEEQISQKQAEEQLGINFVKVTERTLYGGGRQQILSVRKEFSIFRQQSKHRYWSYHQDKANYTLSLPTALRKVLSHYYDFPARAQLVTLQDVSDKNYVYVNGEEAILSELPRLLTYMQQGQIKITAKELPTLSTISKMQRKLDLTEFFPNEKDKVLKNTRTLLIAGLLLTLNQHTIPRVSLPSLIRDYLMNIGFCKTLSSFQLIHREINGTSYLNRFHHDAKRVEPSVFDCLKFIPQEWTSVESLYNNIRYRFIEIEPVKRPIAYDRLYFSIQVSERYKEKRYINKITYAESVMLPYLKGALFLFSAFGLLDIAYDKPDTENMGQTVFSAYDGLHAIRLTNLGKYVCKLSESYETEFVLKQHKLSLSEDALLITAEKDDKTSDVLLDAFTNKIGPNRYVTDSSIFLKNCYSGKDLDEKINLFKQSVVVSLPQNWELFFKELKTKIDPLDTVEDMAVFQIPKENNNLVRLVARDSQLKSLIYKAEHYMILVPRKNLNKFKKRLQEFGYLMTK